MVVTDPEPYPVAYLRVGGGSLIPKEGWTRPTCGELRRMLGLDQEDPGSAGLDEGGKELLADLRGLPRSQINVRIPEDVALPTEPVDEEAAFHARGRWFAASVSGRTRPDEDIGQELDRSFQSIQRMYPFPYVDILTD